MPSSTLREEAVTARTGVTNAFLRVRRPSPRVVLAGYPVRGASTWAANQSSG